MGKEVVWNGICHAEYTGSTQANKRRVHVYKYN